MNPADIDQYELIRKWVRNGEHQGSLGKWVSTFTQAEGEAFWIGSPTLVGSTHFVDGTRMAISINCYRAADTGGYREIVKAFDERHAKEFPARKTLVKRSAPEKPVNGMTLDEKAEKYDEMKGAGLFSSAALGQEPPYTVEEGQQPPRRKLVKRGGMS